MTDVINALCPGPSYVHLFKDICLLLAKDSEKVWYDDQCNIKSKYTKSISVFCSCTKVAKTNTFERKVRRVILYKETTNN